MKNTLALAAFIVAACTSNPTENTGTVATDTVTVTDTVPRTMAQLKIHGYLTPLPDRRFCVYQAPIPADTTKRSWWCFIQADTSAHYSR